MAGVSTPHRALDDLLLSKEEFYNLYRRFWALNDSLPVKLPMMGHKELDFFLLYKEVLKFGGYHNVIQGACWQQIWKGLPNYDPTTTDASYRLRKNYEKHLLEFERRHEPSESMHTIKSNDAILDLPIMTRRRTRQLQRGASDTEHSPSSKTPNDKICVSRATSDYSDSDAAIDVEPDEPSDFSERASKKKRTKKRRRPSPAPVTMTPAMSLDPPPPPPKARRSQPPDKAAPQAKAPSGAVPRSLGAMDMPLFDTTDSVEQDESTTALREFSRSPVCRFCEYEHSADLPCSAAAKVEHPYELETYESNVFGDLMECPLSQWQRRMALPTMAELICPHPVSRACLRQHLLNNHPYVRQVDVAPNGAYTIGVDLQQDQFMAAVLGHDWYCLYGQGANFLAVCCYPLSVSALGGRMEVVAAGLEPGQYVAWAHCDVATAAAPLTLTAGLDYMDVNSVVRIIVSP